MVRHIHDRSNSNFKAKQKGITLILFVFILGLAITSLSLKLFSASNMRSQREIKSTQALDNAKSAVIANVVTGLSGTGLGQFPCDEDTTLIGFNTEGQARGTCNGAPVVGRFAWRSLNTGDIRDGNADKLWYVLSAGYRATPVNSDTVPALTVNGVSNKAIAILFSPGTVLQSQSRSVPTSTSPPVLSQYLELENSNADNVFTLASPTTSFNDQGLTIEADDIYPLLEKRVLKDVKKYLITYKANWGAFPFPATFSNPVTANYLGDKNNTGGLLPLKDAGVTWGNGTITSIRTSNGSIRTAPCLVLPDANGVANQILVCTVSNQNYNGARTLTIDTNLNNVGLGFYKLMDKTSGSDFSFSPTALKNISTLSYTLNAAGGGAVRLTGTSTTRTANYTITFLRPPQFDDWNVTANIPSYIYKNNWHQLINYQVAAPYLPGGAQLCNSNCLTINRLDVTPNTAVTNVHALLITAGRKLVTTNYRPAPTFNVANPAQNRPSAALADYFDSANNVISVHNVTTGFDFDTSLHPMGTFNDQIEMVE